MAIQDHNLKLTEQQYRDLELPSYSMLSSIEKQGFDVVGGVKTSFNLKFGSLVDMMCFEPHRVDDTFYQGSAVKPPTTNVKNICDIILNGLDGKAGKIVEKVSALGRRKQVKITPHLKDYESDIILAASKLKVYKAYSEQKLLETVTNAGLDYFKDKITSRGKILIKPEMWHHASHTAATLISHPYTAKYFATGIKGIEIIYQYKFDTVVNGRRCKGMLDCLIINHTHKVIIPVDLKTGEEPCKNFPMLYTGYGYYIQGALYREGIMAVIANDFDLMNYKVKPFEFVYISKLNPGRPLIFTVSEDLHKACLNGFTDRYGYYHEGVWELLESYYFSVENNKADYTQDQQDNKGRMEMNLTNITNK